MEDYKFLNREKIGVICNMAIHKYGERHQCIKAIEELGELIQALAMYLNGEDHNVEEEIADTEIMLHQLKIITEYNEPLCVGEALPCGNSGVLTIITMLNIIIFELACLVVDEKHALKININNLEHALTHLHSMFDDSLIEMHKHYKLSRLYKAI